MTRTLGRLTGAGLLTASMLLAPPAGASAACSDMHRSATNSYLWMGSTDTLASARAVYSTIKTYDPLVTGNGFSYAWVMLPGPANFEWAQIGPYKAAGNRTTQYQLQQPGHSLVWGDLLAYAVGTVHDYSVGFDPGNHQFHVYVDGVDKFWTTLSWTPSGAEIYSEIYSMSSQLMGEASSHETYRNDQIMNPAGSWQWYSGAVSWTNQHFATSGNAINVDTWDLCQ